MDATREIYFKNHSFQFKAFKPTMFVQNGFGEVHKRLFMFAYEGGQCLRTIAYIFKFVFEQR